MANYGDWQMKIYVNGLSGARPEFPMTFAELERRAAEAMPAAIWSYVSGGAGDERTQRENVAAFDRWGVMPRMLAGAPDFRHP
jgi:lactate 2-monooxygenase